MSRTIRYGAAFAASLVVALPAAAQRFRVLVSEQDSPQLLVIGFSPCVPAETSDCGAWLVRAVDTRRDSSVSPPAATDHLNLPGGRGRLAIDGATIVFTPAGAARGAAIKGTHGTPLGLAASGDGAWAFAIFDGSGGRPAEVVLIDLDTRSVWEVFRLAAP